MSTGDVIGATIKALGPFFCVVAFFLGARRRRVKI